VAQVHAKIQTTGIGKIATVIGRYYAMDRDHRWERTQKAYEALVMGNANKASSAEEAIRASYQADKSDEFVEPVVVDPNGLIKDNDAVIFFNFRIDRPRQLTKALVLPNFETYQAKKAAFDPYAEQYGLKQYELPGGTTTFKRSKVLQNLFFVTMTEYEKGLPAEVGFKPEPIENPLSRVLANNGLRQLHIAETEKERHVTYYFDGRRERPFDGEDWVKVPSPKVASYDLKPEMAAYEITDALNKRLRQNMYHFVVVNYANPDMVGHTGVLQAGIKACEVVDDCLGKVLKTLAGLKGVAIVTADHGNIEEMIDPKTGEVDTKHSINPVPFVVAGEKFTTGRKVLSRGILADIAPTILSIFGFSKPRLMTGRNLISL
jgi:2,3-bisphosphoglycerate-independent phosphoglycerate mutase